MTSTRVPRMHGWHKAAVGYQAFEGTLWGRRALHRPLWAAAARTAAIALGEVLFWDQAAGSDGQACASCHVNAGADSRTVHQLNPGFRALPSQTRCGAMPPQQTTGSTSAFTADYHLWASAFLFTRFTDQSNRTSGLVSATQAIVASQGVFHRNLRAITPTPCRNAQPFPGTICGKAPVNPAGNGAIFTPPLRCCRRCGMWSRGTRPATFADTHPQSRIRSVSLPPVRLPRGQRARLVLPFPGGASRRLPGNAAMYLCHPEQPNPYDE
jgi:hypothetical protein